MPPIVILFITYARTGYALRTIDSVFKNLKTPAGISWYICDDGSSPEHYTAVINHIQKNGGHICGHHSEKLGYGAGCNKAWQICSQTGPITLWLEDDWELENEWDISQYIYTLLNNNNVGMVRLGHLPIGQSGDAVNIDNRMYLSLNKRPFVYSGNPHLKHDRFMLHYGPMPTGLHPGETEKTHDHNVQTKYTNGPRIIWPLHIGDRYLWGHIGTVPAYDKKGGQ